MAPDLVYATRISQYSLLTPNDAMITFGIVVTDAVIN